MERERERERGERERNLIIHRKKIGKKQKK